MNLLIKISLIVGACMMIACEDDFDELNDTRERHITFKFNTETLFSEILQYDDNSFYLTDIKELPSDCKVRITAYCYNQQDSLVYKNTRFALLDDYDCIKIRHLDKDSIYKFMFIADVVRYNSDEDYYETWFQMNTRRFYNFYLYSDQRDKNCIYNIMGGCTVQLQPKNQVYVIDFSKYTYNGYCVLDNIKGLTLLEGYISYSVSFNPNTFEHIVWGYIGYEYEYVTPSVNSVIIPITLSYADNDFDVKLKTTKLNGVKERTINIANKNHSPFVISFDCNSFEQTKFECY